VVEQASGGRSLADRLNYLFANKTPRDGREYSNEHVAAAIGAIGEVTISQSYIWQLRKSKKDNPTYKHLQALAGFFGVPVSYFFDNEVTDRVNQQLEKLRSEQQRLSRLTDDSDVQLMAMRAGELSPQRRRLIMELLDVVYREQQSERHEANGNARPEETDW
jgi:transcriptional regulator with XRE-family HTH domain